MVNIELTLTKYIRDLVELQNTVVIRVDDAAYSCISHGLTEELLELHLAETQEDITKEAGDVFAYATLLLVAAELDNSIHSIANDSYSSLVTAVAIYLTDAYICSVGVDTIELAQDCAGSFKRYFRGEEVVSQRKIASYACNAVAYNCAEVPLKHILDTNISKLTDRAKRGVMDVGKGDNR